MNPSRLAGLAGLALASLLAARTARAAPSEAPRPIEKALPAPGDGALSLSAGPALPSVETRVGSSAPGTSEGGASGSLAYHLSYQRLVLPNLGIRLFAQRVGWSTDLSKASGDGDRTLYDLGAAPALCLPLQGGSKGIMLSFFVPLSYSFSHAPARAPRQVVREEMPMGGGYRIGVAAEVLLRVNGWLGLFTGFEWAHQHVSHVRRYQRFDGTGGKEELPIAFDFRWLSAYLGVAVLP